LSPSEALWSQLKKTRLIALLAPKRVEDCLTAYEALAPLGVVLEIAFRTGSAQEGIRAVRKKHPDALLLAGTVLTAGQAEEAMDAGVAGVVSPDYIPPVVEACLQRGVMCIPGGLCDVGKQLAHKAAVAGVALEALRAQHPCQWVYKLFPAMAGAPAHLEMARSWKSVYRGLTLVYTGGINAGNVGEIIRRDPGSIICASALCRHVEDAEKMQAEARRWLALLEKDRPQPVQAKPPVKPPGGEEAVVTFGEIMLRLSPPGELRITQARTLDATYGGAEANVAVALANFGLCARFVTALPDHPLGQAVVNALRAHGVDTGHILRQGDRVGIYYLEHGASQRSSRVIYDRAGSSISAVRPGQVDWEAVFCNARWFHTSGITPALGDTTAATTLEALRAAKRAGVTVSMDLNYRGKLWSKEKAREVMTPMMDHVDVVIGNEADAADVFGIGAGASDVSAGQLDVAGYETAARELVSRFGLRMAAITLRESLSASDNRWSACLFDGDTFRISRKYDIHLVDRVGGGDAFSAGLIHGLLSGKSHGEALEFAVAASCLKQTIPGDFNLVSAAEVESLAGGDAAGRIKR